jgi:hypothetical protein
MKSRLLISWLAGLAILFVVYHNWTRRAERTAPDALTPLMSKPAPKPRLPAPAFRSPMPLSHELDEHAARPTNWVSALLEGAWPARLRPEQVAAYLEQNRRSPESLLAALGATDDIAYLEEAIEHHADHPQVAFRAIFNSKSPEDRRRWIEALKKADPGNALPDYLSAREHYKTGQIDQAVCDLVSASGKHRWDDYSREFIQSVEEMHRSSGCSEAESKALAGLGLPLPHLAQLRDLGRQIGELSDLYRQHGDDASAQAALGMGVTLAQRITQGSGPSWLIQEMAGLSTERNLLQTIDPAALFDTGGRTVKDRLSEIARQQEELKRLGQQTEDLLQRLSEPELIMFLDRWKVSGEVSAMRWALNRQGGS